MRKEKILKLAKGYWGKAKNCNAIARANVEKALSKQQGDRREKARSLRKLQIVQINAGSREHDNFQYSRLIYGLSEANVQVNRKVMADLAQNEPLSFRALVEIGKVFS